MEPVVLKEIADAGRSVIEKFEEVASECCHAVVLLTPDDHSQVKNGEPPSWQPRMNVAFELGWFCAKSGRRGITWLCKEGTVLPSDFNMVITQKFNSKVSEDETEAALHRELSPILKDQTRQA